MVFNLLDIFKALVDIFDVSPPGWLDLFDLGLINFKSHR